MLSVFFLFLLSSQNLNADMEATGKIPIEFKSASLENVYQCLPKMKALMGDKSFENLDVLRTELEKIFEFKNPTQRYRWMELKKEGSQERVSLRINQVADPKGKLKLRMQLYQYDKAGLPQEVKVLREHEFNPEEKVIKSYIEGYEIISDEKALYYLAVPSWSALLKFKGPKLVEIEMLKLDGKRRLLCREADMVRPLCQCL